jgi:hypothetical protein
MIFGGVVIHVKVGHGVDPYPEIPVPRSMKGWWMKWFYLRNDSSALLPAFTGGHPVPLPSWGDGVAREDLSKLQPLRENLQQLRQEGLTGMHLLWTFFSHRIQPLWKWRTKMWVYLGPICIDCLSSVELSAVKVEARIQNVLDLGVNPNPGLGPVPLWRRIASVWVSTSGPILVAFGILSFHCACDLVEGLRGGCSEPQDADSPSNIARQEARHASSVETHVHEERKISVPPDGQWKGRGQRPLLDLPPLSPRHTTPSLHREAIPLWMGTTAGEHRPKHPLAEGRLTTNSSR